jgi:hypothetical protein
VLYNLNISIISVRAMHYLDQRVGPVLLSSKKLPEDGIQVPKYVGV